MKFDTATKEMAKQKTSELFAEIDKICSANETQGIHVSRGETSCTITNGRVSLTIDADFLDGELSVSKWDHPLHVPGESISGFQFPGKARSKACYMPDWPSGSTFGWREKSRTAKPFLSVAKLAAMCVSQFTGLVQRDETGPINREWRGNGHPSLS